MPPSHHFRDFCTRATCLLLVELCIDLIHAITGGFVCAPYALPEFCFSAYHPLLQMSHLPVPASLGYKHIHGALCSAFARPRRQTTATQSTPEKREGEEMALRREGKEIGGGGWRRHNETRSIQSLRSYKGEESSIDLKRAADSFVCRLLANGSKERNSHYDDPPW